jgi:soluble lytic murein transglycosylase-like protein
LQIFTRASAEFMSDRDSPVYFLGRVSPALQSCIIEAAQVYRLPIPLILALIRQESNFAHQAVSPKGAMGLMQLMPGTAASLGVRDPFDPRENILAGCRYFRFLLDYFQGSVPLALAGYNAGHHRVISAGCQVPAIRETQEFVTQVMGLYYLLEKHAAGL